MGDRKPEAMAARALVGALASQDNLVAFRRAKTGPVIFDDEQPLGRGHTYRSGRKADGVLQHRTGELEELVLRNRQLDVGRNGQIERDAAAALRAAQDADEAFE